MQLRKSYWLGIAVLLFSGSVLAGSPPTADPGVRNAVREYSQAVVAKFIEDQRYPSDALARGLEGRVLVTAVIGTDGQVRGVKLAESSGHAMLDKAALDKVLATRDLPAPPVLLRGREFTLGVPIIFRIE
jgi:periplasmic protein TonB